MSTWTKLFAIIALALGLLAAQRRPCGHYHFGHFFRSTVVGHQR